MATPAIPLDEFDIEMQMTRRVLERVPSDKVQWKPHQKSFPLGHLAQLVARMPGWFPQMLKETELNLANAVGYTFETTETLLDTFDRNVQEAHEALQRVTGDALDVMWSLKAGPDMLFSMRRRDVARQTLNHLIHHRGQLTVYLRLLDVPVPRIYGPTADEPWGPQPT